MMIRIASGAARYMLRSSAPWLASTSSRHQRCLLSSKAIDEYISQEKKCTLADSEQKTQNTRKAQKMWIAEKPYKKKVIVTYWDTAVQMNPQHMLDEKLAKIKYWEEEGVRMHRCQQGVIHMNTSKDVDQMVKDYSVLKLAGALRDREGCLQLYADLLEKHEINKCRRLLKLYSKENVMKRRSLRNVHDVLALPPLLEIAISSQMGVHAMNDLVDIEYLIQHYSGVALANGVRDREEALQLAANLSADGNLEGLQSLLKPHTKASVLTKRHIKSGKIDFTEPLGERECDLIQRELRNIPRRLGVNHHQRSAVMLALCNMDGVPTLVFTLRAERMTHWPYEVCFPGGKMEAGDETMFDTAKREASEEIDGIFANGYNMLGALRCNWGKIKTLAQNEMAVTPVVAFVGEWKDIELYPCKSEVAEAFTIPLTTLMDKTLWIEPRHNKAPIFIGGPYEIWGLTGYILDRFVKNVLRALDVDGEYGLHHSPSRVMPLGPGPK